jgi:hypothetical protein
MPPKLVRAVPILRDDLNVLIKLTEAYPPHGDECKRSGRHRLCIVTEMHQAADVGGALTLEMECDMNLESGAIKSRRLPQITGSCGTWLMQF